MTLELAFVGLAAFFAFTAVVLYIVGYMMTPREYIYHHVKRNQIVIDERLIEDDKNLKLIGYL